jgi:hypothetical protein
MYSTQIIAQFQGYKATANPQYFTLLFVVPEIYRGVPIVPEDSNVRMVVKSDKFPPSAFVIGKSYSCGVDVGIEDARTDAASGKSYRARIRFDLLSFRPYESKAAA